MPTGSATLALAGQRAETVAEAQRVFGQVEAVMSEVREEFAAPGQPTFEGREIVLGPRAGDFYLVRHGLEEGELVVRQGNFKIDSEIQIQAKPSMMTPEGGGGGGGHDHGGGSGAKKASTDEHAGHKATLPADFQQQVRELYAAYDAVTEAVETADLGRITSAFDQFGQRLSSVDGSQLTGHPRMLWKELSMLLGNDVVEGRDAKQMDEADRVYLLLKKHMRRLREQLSVPAERAAAPSRADRRRAASFRPSWPAFGSDTSPSQRALAAMSSRQRKQATARTGICRGDGRYRVAEGHGGRAAMAQGACKPDEAHRHVEKGRRHRGDCERTFGRCPRKSACWPGPSGSARPARSTSCTARWPSRGRERSGIKTTKRCETRITEPRCSSAPIGWRESFTTGQQPATSNRTTTTRSIKDCEHGISR